ncbi:MAG: PAS domain-containing protein, partial [Phycisphaerae bacterium]
MPQRAARIDTLLAALGTDGEAPKLSADIIAQLRVELHAAHAHPANSNRTASCATKAMPNEPTLEQDSALLRAISNTTGDVIFAKDRAGRLTFANPATLALIGKPADQVLGKTDAEYLKDKDAA